MCVTNDYSNIRPKKNGNIYTKVRAGQWHGWRKMWEINEAGVLQCAKYSTLCRYHCHGLIQNVTCQHVLIYCRQQSQL
ncbi:MAG: hypothetical protein RL172_2027 [Bacteroidota bacterium]|jgi:hypothetical protein